MPGNHKCKQCDTVYPCCADECDEHYWLICTPCETKNHNRKHGITDYNLQVVPEYILEDETGSFTKCDGCSRVMNEYSDLCNACSIEAGDNPNA